MTGRFKQKQSWWRELYGHSKWQVPRHKFPMCLTHYARVEYTSLELRQIGADSRSPGSRGNRSLSHNISSPYSQFSTKNSLPRPRRLEVSIKTFGRNVLFADAISRLHHYVSFPGAIASGLCGIAVFDFVFSFWCCGSISKATIV
jgi:hypothetical protein